MCGLFGTTSLKKADLKKARKALHTLTHRGPDGWSDKLENGVYSGHRRLSIIDLSENGTQPMSHSGVTLTANGEIYNFQPLRKVLEENHNIKFTSDSDSEVLLHGYQTWGIEKLLDEIDGMFAFTIHDSNTNKLILARDIAGIKPLYYSLINGTLSWASELKALESLHGKQNLTQDPTALYDFLTYGYIPHPKSIYKNIHKLPPAHYLAFDLKTKTYTLHRYWQLEDNRHITNVKQAQTLIATTLKQAVKDQLVADVPLGSFLSGGVDSSLVSALAQKEISPKKLTTCAISFTDQSVDETPYAQAVAEHIQSNHKTETADLTTLPTNENFMQNLFDEPFADTSAYPTWLVSKIAKHHMTVVLTGDGGDELFAGYNHYKRWYDSPHWLLGILHPLRPLINPLQYQTKVPLLAKYARKLAVFTLKDPLERKTRLGIGLIKDHPLKRTWAKKLNIPDDYDDYWFYRQYDRPTLPHTSRWLWLDFHTSLPEDMLTKVDRTSMAHALEARVPFLSKTVIETSWQISEKTLLHHKTLKGLLKSIAETYVPHHCLYRPKQGFSLGQAAPKTTPKNPLVHQRLTQFFEPSS